MLIRVDPSEQRPLAEQIAAAVRGALTRGEVVAGDRLPPARELGQSLDVNMHTVLRAYAQLRDDGLIELSHGRAAVVRDHSDAARAHLDDLARQFVEQARRLGLDDDEMTAMVRKVQP